MKTCWSGLMKRRFVWGCVILVILTLCRSRWIIMSVIYIFIILIVLTHPWGYIWSSSPAVLILCRSTTSCTNFLVKIMWCDTRSLSADLRARIRGSQYWHASCIKILNCTYSWITSYQCSILYGCLVDLFLLMIKWFISKLDKWIRLEYPILVPDDTVHLSHNCN